MLRSLGIVALIVMLGQTVAQAEDLSGTWCGTWQDDGSGHSGPINARMTRQTDGSYCVVFTGRFAKVVPFRYKTDLQVVCDGDVVQFCGDRHMAVFGDFHYEGAANNCNFTLRFCSRRYSGSFTITRCTVCQGCCE